MPSRSAASSRPCISQPVPALPMPCVWPLSTRISPAWTSRIRPSVFSANWFGPIRFSKRAIESKSTGPSLRTPKSRAAPAPSSSAESDMGRGRPDPGKPGAPAPVRSYCSRREQLSDGVAPTPLISARSASISAPVLDLRRGFLLRRGLGRGGLVQLGHLLAVEIHGYPA